jgi:hypothetical protein
VTSFRPTFDYDLVTDEQAATVGLDVARDVFYAQLGHGLLNGDSLTLRVGYKDESGQYHDLAVRDLGNDAEQFLPNVDPETGKLSTAIRFDMDSMKAYWKYRSDIVEGPGRYTGGVSFTVYVETKAGWMERTFVGAASGVQGFFDMSVTYAAITTMAAIWALSMQAQHGLAA